MIDKEKKESVPIEMKEKALLHLNFHINVRKKEICGTILWLFLRADKHKIKKKQKHLNVCCSNFFT